MIKKLSLNRKCAKTGQLLPRKLPSSNPTNMAGFLDDQRYITIEKPVWSMATLYAHSETNTK